MHPITGQPVTCRIHTNQSIPGLIFYSSPNKNELLYFLTLALEAKNIPVYDHRDFSRLLYERLKGLPPEEVASTELTANELDQFNTANIIIDREGIILHNPTKSPDYLLSLLSLTTFDQSIVQFSIQDIFMDTDPIYRQYNQITNSRRPEEIAPGHFMSPDLGMSNDTMQVIYITNPTHSAIIHRSVIDKGVRSDFSLIYSDEFYAADRFLTDDEICRIRSGADVSLMSLPIAEESALAYPACYYS